MLDQRRAGVLRAAEQMSQQIEFETLADDAVFVARMQAAGIAFPADSRIADSSD